MANQSFTIYRGPSLYDGKPIVVIAQISTKNRKTGNMVQTYILREDIDPISASRTGEDKSICGDCPHMGKPNLSANKGQALQRTCYVTLAHGPLGKWKAYRKGAYPESFGHFAIAAIGKGRMVRLGTYGDPAAVPSYVWESLLSESLGHTAYTHGAVNPIPSKIMTSADNASQALAAWERGERTFRIISDISAIMKGREVLCPASEEAGKKTDCANCKLCGGASIKGKSVAIVAHGTAKAKAKAIVA